MRNQFKFNSGLRKSQNSGVQYHQWTHKESELNSREKGAKITNSVNTQEELNNKREKVKQMVHITVGSTKQVLNQ